MLRGLPFYLILVGLFCFQSYLSSQTMDCNTTVDAGEDIEICEPGGEIDLIGSVMTDPDYTIVNTEWTGPNITDPDSLVTTADPGGSATYTLNVKIRQSNAIVNGDFESGNIFFSSDYTVPTPPYSPLGPLGPEGTYLISDDPSDTHDNFAPCDDHTTGNGNMMVVNGNTQANAQIWCQTVAVDPNTTYEFSAWVTSVISESPAQLQFTIDGVLIGSVYSAPSTPCLWTEFSQQWTSDGSGNDVQICITNQNTEPSGNDFALDDIYFGKVCEISDEKVVEVLENSEFTLDTFVCQGESITIENQTFSGEGEHGPITLQAANGCDSLLTVNIENIQLTPVIENPQLLTCDRTEVTISAENSIIEPSGINPSDITYEWTTNDGNIISGNESEIIVVNEPGTYFLTILYDNGSIQCSSEQISVEVLENVQEPDVSIDVEQDDCTTAVWDLTANTDVPNPIYTWSTANGQLPGQTDLETVVATAEGTYILELTDPSNGCVGSDTVTVSLNELNFNISGDTIIDCENLTSTLYADGSSGYDYEWYTDGGNILGNVNADSINIDAEGTYSLIAFSDECMDTISVEVESFIDTVLIDLKERDTIDCSNPSIQLNAMISGADSFDVQWTTFGGNFQGMQDTSTTTINSGGVYYIQVSTVGNCIATDSIIVEAESDVPSIQFAEADTINCQNETVTIDASQSDTSEFFVFDWSTKNGNIISTGADNYTIEVDESAFYTLQLTDTLNGCSVADSIFVEIDTGVLNLDAGPSDTLTCQRISLKLRAQLDSFALVDSIDWSTVGGSFISGTDSLTPLVNSSGLYILRVWKNSSHCISTDSVRIFTDENLPDIAPTDDLVLNCYNPSVTIDKTGSTSSADVIHSWQVKDNGNIVSGQSTYSIEVDQPGTYIFTLLNQSSLCVNSDTIRITEDFESPNVSIPPPDTLNCSEDVVDINPQNQSNDYVYVWSTSNGNYLSDLNSPTAQVNAAADYTLTVNDTTNGCSQTILFEVEIDTFTPSISFEDTLSLDCATSTLDIQPTINTDGVFSIEWETTNGHIIGNADQLDIQVDSAGTYLTTIRDESSQCENSQEITVVDNSQQPYFVSGPDRELSCEKTSAILSLDSVAPDVTINWLNANGDILATDTSAYSTSDVGVYYVEITNQAMCTAVDSIIVTENIEIDSVDAGRDAYIGCGRETINLMPAISTQDDYDFFWLSPADDTLNSENIQVDSPGVYKVFAVNSENGCHSSDIIEILETDTLSAESTVIPPACANGDGSITLDNITGGLSPYSATLDGRVISEGDTARYSAGNYVLEIEDQLGCIYRKTLMIEEGKDPEIEFPGLYTIGYGDSVQLQPLSAPDTGIINSIQWSPTDNLSCVHCLNPYAFPENTTQYFISLTDTNGCMAEASVTVRVDRTIKYYIPNAFSPNLDGVNEYFWPQIGQGVESIETIEIFNRWGDRMYVIDKPDPDSEELGWDGTFRGKDMNAGVYMYKIQLLLSTGELRTLSGPLTLLR